MPYKKIATRLLLGAALTCLSSANAITIDYSSTVNSSIHFDGANHFDFLPAANSFHVDSGTAAGLLGDMAGSYSIGDITTFFGVSLAPVTGAGTLVIHDGAFDLSGNLVWSTIVQLGSGDFLNVSATVNLTGITYGGVNPDLLALATAGSGMDVLSFQFVPPVSLASLKTSAHDASFSGSISDVPDSGLSLSLLGFALMGIEGLRRKLGK